MYIGGFQYSDIEGMPPFERKRFYEKILGVREKEIEEMEKQAANIRIKRSATS